MGKSSIAQAVGAALCGHALMLDGLTKAMAGLLVHVGAAEASVEIRSEAGSSRITWPGCDIVQTGTAPKASQWAAGLASVALLDARERAQVLAEYLHATPTREDLAQELGKADLGDERVLTAIWQLIEANGWDAAHENRREIGANLKGRWRQATGQTYGSRKAQSWRPEAWTEDLDVPEETGLAAAVIEARQAHEQAIAAVAVSGAERHRLEAQAATVEDTKDALTEAEIEEARLEEELTKAEAARAALPPAGADVVMPCPYCGGELLLRQVDLATRVLEKAESIPPAERQRRRLAIADADGTVGRLQEQLGAQGRAVERARHAMQQVLDAQHRLANLPAVVVGGDKIAWAKAELDAAEAHQKAWRTKREADNLAERIRGNDLMLDILAPVGLRARKLAQQTDKFNETIVRPLCDAAEWAAVTLDADASMTIRYSGRPYALLSTSEQYRVRAVLAVAMAQLDGSGMVVLDAADVLDGTTRSGLFALLEEAALPALVAMTLTRPGQCPDLAEIGAGCSYWIRDGVARPLHEEMAHVA